ncbi:hypothetical protein QFC21_004585 [Naganishia friedmannii]|uniref:Uncharacterized protein n=1 Tax=Naganishia friedmannii TaxID=89922 RepID=A0ACC2VGQ3_9TREE|nr:hypothetical protein QFC21_004585 [Naganishia friedmannii]
MSGPHVVLGKPIGTRITESVEMGQAEPVAEVPDFSRLQPQTSAKSDPAGTESLASSQTMAGFTPPQEIPAEVATTKPGIKNVMSEKISGRTSSDGDGRSIDGEREMSEKGRDQKEMVELQDGLVFLGTEKQTGKAIIKHKQQLQGGPHTQPKWQVRLSYLLHEAC